MLKNTRFQNIIVCNFPCSSLFVSLLKMEYQAKYNKILIVPILIENSTLDKFTFTLIRCLWEKKSCKWFAMHRTFRLRYRISTLAFSQSRFETKDGRKDLTVTYTPAGFFSFRLRTASGTFRSFPSNCTKIIATYSSRNSWETIAAVLLHNFVVSIN